MVKIKKWLVKLNHGEFILKDRVTNYLNDDS
ncbi:Protein of unknown function [Lactobacillus pasteurii DSM 23907 = CRBIP 24.76]|uniref:Uncharacterized protein n=1 Tax=Lactobacillus pasteurii DSM 23907 = CRBIP 24.76 TaxID=1423790 RepID=I7JX83_9LACO|nr:Protein of unknown function [Lactobacillus pasteurii DSM 23907 = CRBIP 24.76]